MGLLLVSSLLVLAALTPVSSLSDSLAYAQNDNINSANTSITLTSESSPRSMSDNLIDSINAGVDSFAPFAAGQQHFQLVDGLIDWINANLDGVSKLSSKSQSEAQNEPLPIAV